jgi:anti-anti-sigma regulatory factor
VKCESCLLTSEEGASLPLAAFLERIELCNECPIERGVEPPGLVSIQRLLGRHREASRAMRKLTNKVHKAERHIKELEEGISEYEERAAKLEVIQQTGILQANDELRAKMELIRQKEEAIKALWTPIIEVWEGVLVLPVIGALDDDRAGGILASLLQRVAQRRARHAILDMTGVDRIDAGTADHLGMIGRAVSMLGARIILSGIQPEVVRELIELRVDLSGMVTERSLKEALRRCGVAGARRRKTLQQAG